MQHLRNRIKHTHTHNRFTALWILSGTTRVSRYQKKHSPTPTYCGHQSSLICFLHLLWSMASSLTSLFKLRAWQSFSTISLRVFFGLPLGLALTITILGINLHTIFQGRNVSSHLTCLMLHLQMLCGYGVISYSFCGVVMNADDRSADAVSGENLWHPHISGLSLHVAVSITWLSLLKNRIFIFSKQWYEK